MRNGGRKEKKRNVIKSRNRKDEMVEEEGILCDEDRVKRRKESDTDRESMSVRHTVLPRSPFPSLIPSIPSLL